MSTDASQILPISMIRLVILTHGLWDNLPLYSEENEGPPIVVPNMRNDKKNWRILVEMKENMEDTEAVSSDI